VPRFGSRGGIVTPVGRIVPRVEALWKGKKPSSGQSLIKAALRGEPWGRKPCRLKAGGRFATSCRLTPPRNAGRRVWTGTPEMELGHPSGGQKLLNVGLNIENTGSSGVHPKGGPEDFKKEDSLCRKKPKTASRSGSTPAQ